MVMLNTNQLVPPAVSSTSLKTIMKPCRHPCFIRCFHESSKLLYITKQFLGGTQDESDDLWRNIYSTFC